MIANKQHLLRISRLTTIALASLLTIFALVALASSLKGQPEIAALLDRYSPVAKPQPKEEDKDKNKDKKRLK